MLKWQQYCLTEPSVNCILGDLIRPADIVFDVGAHHGNLSIVMGRLTGPNGRVVSFEANPKTAVEAVENLRRNWQTNVFIINRAVTEETGNVVPLYQFGGVGDSIFQKSQTQKASIDVLSLRLDDYINEMKLEPDVIKFDIEGAEYIALKGLSEYLGKKKPAIIIEQTTDDFACVELLMNYGYFAVDLHTYMPLRTKADYQTQKAVVRNVLCLHPGFVSERAHLSSYIHPRTEAYVTFGPDQFDMAGAVCHSPLIELSPGRYVLEWEYEFTSTDKPIRSGLKVKEDVWAACYHGRSQLLSSSYRQMPFHAETKMTGSATLMSDGEWPIADVLVKPAARLLKVYGFGSRPVAAMVLG